MLKVLLVEDENLIRRGLQYKMDWTEVNCVVVGEAATGQEGLTQIKALRPDIVITDIRMPDMDGLEMLREGRAVCPFHAIIISGYGEFDYAQQAIRLGVAEYLLKPVDVNELKNCLRRIAASLRVMLFGKAYYVTINGKRCTVLGHIGMLHTAADVSGIQCSLGDMVRVEINPLMQKGMDVEWR